MSDRVIVMNKGRIEQVGGPREIYQSPATAFVADFVGTSNFLRGHVARREGALAHVALAGGGEIAVPDKGLTGDVQIALRPQFCTVQSLTAQVPEGANALQGKIARVTYFGERSEASVDVNGTELLVFLSLDTSMQVGETVRVTFAPASCTPLPV